jgi:hypothetical protein
MYLREVKCGDMDWIALAQGKDIWWALVNAVMNLWSFIKYGEYLE